MSELVGAWECVKVATPKWAASVQSVLTKLKLLRRTRHVKLVTPHNFAWVLYDPHGRVPIATAGGTWNLTGETYEERYDFASGSHRHLRGKRASYKVAIKGDAWLIYGQLDTGFVVSEEWRRIAPQSVPGALAV